MSAPFSNTIDGHLQIIITTFLPASLNAHQ